MIVNRPQSTDVQSLVQSTTTVHAVTCALIHHCETAFERMPNVCLC